jgi:hypothetical protein
MRWWEDDKPKKLPRGLRLHLKRTKLGLPSNALRPAPQIAEPVNYEAYMKSQAWSDFRCRWFSDRSLPNNCVACGGSSYLELHHVTYKRLGEERLNDVVPLCRRCHIEFHERYTSHQCRGLMEFRSQLSIAFRLSSEVVAIRLKPFLEFVERFRKQDSSARSGSTKITKRQAKAVKKLSGAVRFQAFHDKYSPRRHNPFS